jgi:hypothetical protein
MITSGRGDGLITISDTCRGHDQCGASEVVRRRWTATHDQQPARGQISHGRPDVGCNHRNDRARVEQPPDNGQGRWAAAADKHRQTVQLEAGGKARW